MTSGGWWNTLSIFDWLHVWPLWLIINESLSNYLSSSFWTASTDNLYWNPEHPPPSTAILRYSPFPMISASLCRNNNQHFDLIIYWCPCDWLICYFQKMWWLKHLRRCADEIFKPWHRIHWDGCSQLTLDRWRASGALLWWRRWEKLNMFWLSGLWTTANTHTRTHTQCPWAQYCTANMHIITIGLYYIKNTIKQIKKR